MPKRALTNQEIEDCFDVMSELRSHLKRECFLSTVRAMEAQGYQLAYIDNGETVVAVAGYRINTNLFMGKHLYVDDLVTAEEVRSQGYGEQLLSWLRYEGERQGCKVFHLDSGTHRSEAHKFYFRQGFKIASFHFSQHLGDD
ncbi:MAG: GNAT family N-acetyltransferase [Gammaproteobacteria bacterium]|nr:GNAT family N-acetyltransferase [Gammaproteobacteria bacterium]MBQ0838543.1 GNAT family N-acetyltransferase [Gammaproteobacteria bacterium]